MDVHRLHDEAFAADPLPAWRELRDHHPVYHDTVDDVYVLSRHDDVKWAFTEATFLSNRVYGRTVGKVFGASMLQMDGREHVQRRKVVAPQFVGSRLDRYAAVVQAVADGIAAEVAKRSEFDVVADVSQRMPGVVMATLLGLPRADFERFFGWYNAMMAGFWNDPELRRRGHEAHLEFQEYLVPLIAERRRSPGEDLISHLLAAEVEGERLDGEDLGSFLSLLLVAGGETTDKAIANLWWCLVNEPDVLARVRADPSLLDPAFSELLRMFPSLIYLGRETLEPFERHGVEVPAGAVVRLNVASANRDERVFVDPDRFWPERPDLHLGRELRSAPMLEGRASHLGFGAGAHFCIGYQLARLESITVTRTVLAALGPRLEVLDAPPPLTAPPARTIHRLVLRHS